jgi:hypothetical protein
MARDLNNKAVVLLAFDTLLNNRDYAREEAFWSQDHIQHSAHIAPGQAGLFDLVRAAPSTLRYEHGLILADANWAMDVRRHGWLSISCG